MAIFILLEILEKHKHFEMFVTNANFLKFYNVFSFEKILSTKVFDGIAMLYPDKEYSIM